MDRLTGCPSRHARSDSQFAEISSYWIRGRHNFHFGGEFQRIGADFNLWWCSNRRDRVRANFADQDRNGDGVVDDKDLLFAVAIRSGIRRRGRYAFGMQ